MERKLIYLSKTISHALRHEPWLYELELDEEGWVSVEALIVSLKQSNNKWEGLSKSDLISLTEQSEKKRYEIQGNKIRALYGHSIPGKLIKKPASPPEILYHSTAPTTIEQIKLSGLLPMNRHYVHLSIDIAMAEQVGRRKSNKPVLLRVRAKSAYSNNINFYMGNDLV